nr:hypothetical protein GCM10020093_004130 [Planobispora longispora]
MEGAIDLGAPLYFIGGNHEPWPALDDAGPGRWGGVARFLGRSGVGEVAGLRVAFLSGIYAARVTDAPAPAGRRPRTAPTTRGRRWSGWASPRSGRGRRHPADPRLALGHRRPRLGAHVGRPELRALCERVRPRWHFCGHMHRPHRASIGPAEVVCLAHIRSGYAALAVIEREAAGRPSASAVSAAGGPTARAVRPDETAGKAPENGRAPEKNSPRR